MRNLSLSLLALPLLTVPALAQQQAPCFPYETIAAALLSDAKESPVARMLDSRGNVVEILATVDGSTYTILIVNPNGTACAVSTGEAFAFVTGTSAPVPGTDS